MSEKRVFEDLDTVKSILMLVLTFGVGIFCLYDIGKDAYLYFFGERRTVEVCLVTESVQEYRVKHRRPTDPKYITEYRYYWQDGFERVEIIVKRDGDVQKQYAKRFKYGDRVEVVYSAGSKESYILPDFDFSNVLRSKLPILAFFALLCVLFGLVVRKIMRDSK